MTISKFLFTSCGLHKDCTLKASFVTPGDPAYDQTADRKAISIAMEDSAKAEFGDVFCVDIEHLPGALKIKRVD